MNPIIEEFYEFHAETGNTLSEDAFLFTSGMFEGPYTDRGLYSGVTWVEAYDTIFGLWRKG